MFIQYVRMKYARENKKKWRLSPFKWPTSSIELEVVR